MYFHLLSRKINDYFLSISFICMKILVIFEETNAYVMKNVYTSSFRVRFLISCVYLLLVSLYFLPIDVPCKMVFPLAFLTLCALRYASRPIVFAMFFSALGDWMGMSNHFIGQMSAFGIAHIAFMMHFWRSLYGEGTSGGSRWKWSVVVVYGLVAGGCILPHVEGYLKIGVLVYVLLILLMCGSAWMQKCRWYVWGAWMFVISDTILAWNKFVSPIEWVGYFIMIPYYLGQWTLFITSIAPKNESSVSCE